MKKFFSKCPCKHLTYTRVSYIIVSLFGLFLLNFVFIFNKPNERFAKPSKKFTITKLLGKIRRFGDRYEFRKKN